MKTGQNHAPKVYELVERQTENPAIKADMKSLIHLYAGFAMCCDGEKTMRVNLTDEQIVQLAADACEQAAKILRWGADHEQSGKDRPDAAGGNL